MYKSKTIGTVQNHFGPIERKAIKSSFWDLSMLMLGTKPFFLKQLPDLDEFIPRGTKITNNGPFLWIGSSKIQIFTDIRQSFCKRLLRAANVTFLKIDG